MGPDLHWSPAACEGRGLLPENEGHLLVMSPRGMALPGTGEAGSHPCLVPPSLRHCLPALQLFVLGPQLGPRLSLLNPALPRKIHPAR